MQSGLSGLDGHDKKPGTSASSGIEYRIERSDLRVDDDGGAKEAHGGLASVSAFRGEGSRTATGEEISMASGVL